MNFYPQLLFCISWNSSSTSNKHNFLQQPKGDLYFHLRSTTGWRGVGVLLEGLISSHINASFCLYFACWPQYTSSPSLEIITQVVRATLGVGEREGDFWGREGYFPVVICASLVKNSTFILVWELSLPVKIFSSPEGFRFLPPQSSLNKNGKELWKRRGFRGHSVSTPHPLQIFRPSKYSNARIMFSQVFPCQANNTLKKKSQDKIYKKPWNLSYEWNRLIISFHIKIQRFNWNLLHINNALFSKHWEM